MLHYSSSSSLLEIGSQTSLDCSYSKYERDCDTTASSSGDLNDKPAVVKSSLCKEFQSQGSCSEGVLCSQAHSLQQLLKQPQASCSTMCASYHGNMSCTLGKDCNFLHSESPLQEIVRQQRKGNRFHMLSEYPELLLIQAGSHNTSILF